MATSRRRERELARRRFERRRQAELERRARAKRRNTIIGAVVGTIAVITVIVVLAVTLVGGSGKKSVKAGATPTPSTSTTPTAPPAPTRCATISPNPPIKGAPKFPQVKGKLTNQLVIKDLKKGHGRAAQQGDTLQVLYTGVSCDSGKMFDSSYRAKPVKPFSVSPLGSAQVITGWNRGLIGVRAGGVRELIIPAAEAYGPSGYGGIKGNDTLDFVVQVKSVTKK